VPKAGLNLAICCQPLSANTRMENGDLGV
jgi:hypothetical protein